MSLKTKFFAIAFILLAGWGAINQYRLSSTKQLLQRSEANLKASNDSLRITKNKQGEEEFNKLSYIVANVEELKSLNKRLADEVKDIKGKVKNIQSIDFQIKHDTINTETIVDRTDTTLRILNSYDTLYSKGNYRLFMFENKYNLKTNVVSGRMLTDVIGFTATTGLKKLDGAYKIFVTPHYPGMEVTHLEGAIIDDGFFKRKKKKITLGAGLHYVPVALDVKTRQFDFNPYRIGATIGINYNF